MNICCTWLTTAVLAAGAVVSQVKPDYAAEAAKLVSEYQAAEKAFYAPYYNAKSDEERAKIELDFNKHPGKQFLKKFQNLAQKAAGTQGGAVSELWVLRLANVANNPAAGKAALKHLQKDYIQWPIMAEVVQEVRYSGSDDDVIPFLRDVVAKTNDKKTKLSAKFTLAARLYGWGSSSKERKEEAERLFEQVTKDDPKSDAAKQAESYLFELRNLQVGMTAPDFEAVDQDGVKFKLSDYRGQVVVLDFWGFW